MQWRLVFKYFTLSFVKGGNFNPLAYEWVDLDCFYIQWPASSFEQKSEPSEMAYHVWVIEDD